jgi:hypothetical protein
MDEEHSDEYMDDNNKQKAKPSQAKPSHLFNAKNIPL